MDEDTVDLILCANRKCSVVMVMVVGGVCVHVRWKDLASMCVLHVCVYTLSPHDRGRTGSLTDITDLGHSKWEKEAARWIHRTWRGHYTAGLCLTFTHLCIAHNPAFLPLSPQRSWCQSHSEGSAQKISHGSASYQQLSQCTKALRSGSKGKRGEGLHCITWITTHSRVWHVIYWISKNQEFPSRTIRLVDGWGKKKTLKRQYKSTERR